MRSLSLAVALSFSVVTGACGGKILEEPGAGGSSGTSGGSSGGSSGSSGFHPRAPTTQPDPPATAPPVPSAPSPPSNGSVADACETICHRNAQCGAWQSDCNAHCEGEIQAAAACAPQANAYIHCYADNLDTESCTALPPVCEDAYCAYTRCAGKVVPAYCP